MIEGLSRSEQKSPDFNFQLVYWAHFLHPVPLDPTVGDKKHPLFVEDPYIPATNIGQSEKSGGFRKKLMDYLGGQMDRIILNEDLSINFTSISDFIIHRFFSELEVYYASDEGVHITVKEPIREQTCLHLANILKRHRRKQILLIAHSMGSIIAYDVLTHYVPEVEIDTLVTIGSPLGLPIIRSKIGAEMAKTGLVVPVLTTPENVRNGWYNLADLRDKIAFFYELGDAYRANSKGVKVVDQTVMNNYVYKGEKNPHKTYGYLRSAEMANIINEFMKRKPSSTLTRIQSFLKKQSERWFGYLHRWKDGQS